MKNLLKMSDLSPAELTHILDVADQLKADCKAGRTEPLLAGKSVALLFSKASTSLMCRLRMCWLPAAKKACWCLPPRPGCVCCRR